MGTEQDAEKESAEHTAGHAGGRRKILMASMAIGVSLIVMCALFEPLLALLALPPNYMGCYRIDERFGFHHTPGAGLCYTLEGFSRGRFNSKGLRDVERAYEKPADVTRILVLGDSFVEALQVSLTEAFCQRLEQRLNAPEGGGRRHEVINTGVQGWGTAQQFLYLKDEGMKYDPDVVILAFFANDITTNTYELESLLFTERSARQRPYLVKRDGRLVVDRSAFDAFLAEEAKQRSLWRRMGELRTAAVLSKAFARFRKPRATAASPPPDPILTKALVYYARERQAKQQWRHAQAVTRAIFANMKALCDERAVRLIVTNLPGGISYRPEAFVRKAYGDILKGYTFDQNWANDFCRGAAASLGIEFVDLLPAFRAYADKDALDFHSRGSQMECHYAPAGHALVARELFRHLRSAPSTQPGGQTP